MGVKGFRTPEGSIEKYDYKYLENTPTKLSDFKNDIFGEQREVINELTESSFVYDETLSSYTIQIGTKITWLVADNTVNNVLGYDLVRYNSSLGAYELITEQESPFVVENGVISFENFKIFNGLKPSTTGEYGEVDECWILCNDPNFGEEGYINLFKKYTKGLSNIEQVSSLVEVTIPAGRMRGDVDEDGKITSYDAELIRSGTGSAGYAYYNQSLATLFPDGNIPLDYLAADVDGNGSINSSDRNAISSSSFKAGKYTEVTGNWTNNPNYATEEGQFYTDIPITGMTASHSASVIVKGTFENGFFTKAECIDGAIRIYAKLCPISEVTAVVAWGTGDGTAVITSESEDLTKYDEHVANTDIHVTLDEKTAWNEKDVFIATYGKTTNAEIEAAYQVGKVLFCKKDNYIAPFVLRSSNINHTFAFSASDTRMSFTCVSNHWATNSYQNLPESSVSNVGKVLTINDSGYWSIGNIATHAPTHASGGSDPITPEDIGAAPSYTYGTEDLTAGTSSLETGKLYFVYE